MNKADILFLGISNIYVGKLLRSGGKFRDKRSFNSIDSKVLLILQNRFQEKPFLLIDVLVG
jgi:hypothetical protein